MGGWGKDGAPLPDPLHPAFTSGCWGAISARADEIPEKRVRVRQAVPSEGRALRAQWADCVPAGVRLQAQRRRVDIGPTRSGHRDLVHRPGGLAVVNGCFPSVRVACWTEAFPEAARHPDCGAPVQLVEGASTSRPAVCVPRWKGGAGATSHLPPDPRWTPLPSRVSERGCSGTGGTRWVTGPLSLRLPRLQGVMWPDLPAGSPSRSPALTPAALSEALACTAPSHRPEHSRGHCEPFPCSPVPRCRHPLTVW